MKRKLLLLCLFLAIGVLLRVSASANRLSLRNDSKKVTLSEQRIPIRHDRNSRKALNSGEIYFKSSAPKKTEGSVTTCYYETSYIDYYGDEVTWQSTFVFDSENQEVKIENMFKPILYDYDYDCVDVVAPFVDGKITFQTASPYEDEDATIVGSNEWDDYVSLLGGELVNNADGSQGVNLMSLLTLNVSDDFQTISVPDNYVIVLYEVSEDYGENVIFDSRQGGSVWNRLLDEAVSKVSTTELDFGEIYSIETTTAKLSLSSMGSTPVAYSVELADPDHFSAKPTSGTVYYGSATSITVTFKPEHAGEYESTMTIHAADQDYVIKLYATALDVVSDFSPIITSGNKDFFSSWENSSETPWLLDEDKHLASVDNSKRIKTDAPLIAHYTAEKATRMTFDFNVSCEATDSLIMYVDSDRAFAYTSKYSGEYSYNLPKGTHAVKWVFKKGTAGSGKDYVEFGNIRLEDAVEFDGISPDNSVKSYTLQGWSAYDKCLRPSSNSADATAQFTVSTSAAENCIDFNAEASPLAPLSVYVDGDKKATLTESGPCHLDVDGTGEHTVSLVVNCSENADAISQATAVSNIRTFASHYSEVTTKYVVLGDSYLDIYDQFTANDGVVGVNCAVDVTYTSTGRFFLKNFINESGDLIYRTIEGRISDGKVIFDTKPNVNTGTFFAYDSQTYNYTGFAGDRWWLVAGDITGAKLLADYQFVDQLVMDISGDMDVLTPTTGFGLWYTYRFNNQGITEFLKKGVRWEKATDETAIIASASNIDFGEMFAQSGKIVKEVVVVNKGNEESECSVEIQGANKTSFTVSPTTFDLKPFESKTLEVSFQPSAAGDFSAEMTVYSEGNDCAISLKGIADEMPDYSSMVTAGKEYITGWETSSEYPWLVDDEAIYSTNTDHHSTVSSLSMKVNIPEGKLAQISFDSKFYVEPEGDFFHVKVDNKDIIYLDQSRKLLVGSEIVEAGEHTVYFAHEKDYMTLIPSKDVSEISNIRIDLYDKTDDCAISYAPRYHYDYVAPVNEDTEVYFWIINKGVNNLSISGAETDSQFTVCDINPADTFCPGDTIPVRMLIHPNAPGLCKSDILIHSTAGDIKCTYDAKADYVRYLGSREAYTNNFPVCSNYIGYNVYPIYTQSLYYAKDLEGLENCKFKSITFETVIESDIDFTASDVNYRVGSSDATTLTENHVEGLTTIYEGEQIDIVDYEQTIPFSEPYVYTGGNFMIAHDLNDKEGFKTPVYYYCANVGSGLSAIYLPDTPSFGLMKDTYVPLVRINYEPKEDSVPYISADGQNWEVISIHYYNATGIEMPGLTSGINFVVTKYSDGTTKATKVIKR